MFEQVWYVPIENTLIGYIYVYGHDSESCSHENTYYYVILFVRKYISDIKANRWNCWEITKKCIICWQNTFTSKSMEFEAITGHSYVINDTDKISRIGLCKSLAYQKGSCESLFIIAVVISRTTQERNTQRNYSYDNIITWHEKINYHWWIMLYLHWKWVVE